MIIVTIITVNNQSSHISLLSLYCVLLIHPPNYHDNTSHILLLSLYCVLLINPPNYHYNTSHILLLSLSTKTECDYLNGWIKKQSHTQKSHPKVVNPRDIAGERKKKKKKKKLLSLYCVLLINPPNYHYNTSHILLLSLYCVLINHPNYHDNTSHISLLSLYCVLLIHPPNYHDNTSHISLLSLYCVLLIHPPNYHDDHYHHHCLQPVQTGQQVSPILKRCHQVLDPLTRAVPGLMEGLYLIAKVKYLAGKWGGLALSSR